MKKSLLDIALIQARKNLHNHPDSGSFLHWSFIVQDNKILGYSTNDFGPTPTHFGYKVKLDIKDNATRHAEFRALTKMKGIINFRKPWMIINIRLNNRGVPRVSAPCERCYSLMKKFGCCKFYFTTNTGWAKTI